MSDQITPGERRELRSVVKGQYRVLRAELKRREQEMAGEMETDLAHRYAAQDEAISEAQRDVQRAIQDCVLVVEAIGATLKEKHPELDVESGRTRYGGIGLNASDKNRAQIRRAALASIPNKVGDAGLELDRQGVDLLRKLSEGALDSEAARGFLNTIPIVGELVPRARLREIENSLRS